MTARARTILLLVACGAATFALKLWANATRVEPGHGDTCYYLHVAQNLYRGRGFVCDYVWSYLENPSGAVPAPAFAWWMPGPSVVSLVGMWFAGAASYAAAKVAMAAFTSLLPAVVWWTAWAVARDRALAARAAVLSTAFHLFLDQPAAPLSHGPYGMIVGAALALLASAPLTARRGVALGALIALGHLFRGDALTLFGTAAVLAAVSARRSGARLVAKPLVVALAAYLVVMAPWFARNVVVFGRLMPSGPSKALFLRDYYDWFALPGRLDAAHYFEDGAAAVFGEKVDQTGTALRCLATSYFDPTLPPAPEPSASPIGAFASAWRASLDPSAALEPDAPPWLFLRHVSIAMTALTALGLLRLALRGGDRRWIAVFSLQAAAEIAFYAWLFTGVANQSYVSSLYALYPLFVVAMAAALEIPRKPVLSWALVVLLALANAIGAGAYLRAHKGPATSQVRASYARIAERLEREGGFRWAADKVMLRDVWDLYAATPVGCVRLPDESLARVITVARRLNVEFLLLEDPKTLSFDTRPYRRTIYRVLEEPSDFNVIFQDLETGLYAVRILPSAFEKYR